MIKRLLIIFGLVLPTLVLAVPQFASATDPLKQVCEGPNAPTDSTVCKDKNTGGENPIVGPNGVLSKAITIIAIIVGIAAVFSMIISGFRMITSGGDAARVASARNGIIYSLVGIVVAVSAQIVVSFVLSKVGT